MLASAIGCGAGDGSKSTHAGGEDKTTRTSRHWSLRPGLLSRGRGQKSATKVDTKSEVPPRLGLLS
jgi:hypothetical protein